jgi:hypothetical protein
MPTPTRAVVILTLTLTALVWSGQTHSQDPKVRLADAAEARSAAQAALTTLPAGSPPIEGCVTVQSKNANPGWAMAFRNIGYKDQEKGFVEFWLPTPETAKHLCEYAGHSNATPRVMGVEVPDQQGWAPYGNLQIVRVTEAGEIERLCSSGSECFQRAVPYISRVACCH